MFWFKKKKAQQINNVDEIKNENYFIDGRMVKQPNKMFFLDQLQAITNKNNNIISEGDFAQDSDFSAIKLNVNQPNAISTELANWYASNSFIGYQMCAILTQNWLINKACSIPARDATRNGYDIVSTNGEELPTETVKLLQRYDRKYRALFNAEQFVRMGRIFGIRIALFDIETDDPDFYEKPFNIDGVEKGSYKGIIQVDPYWCTPQIVSNELSNPASRYFYEPTYWLIGGKRYHRSHLFIFRNSEVPDILKPVYYYGGLPIPQIIMSRVYTAERSTDESLGLLLSKKTTIWKTNMDMFMADAETNAQRLQNWIDTRDNYGIKVGDIEGDEFQQFDTTLSDLDEIIMTNYQIVAAAANVPATKLLGTSPKGFSSGEEETKNYHEELESIQEHDLTEFIERHHQLVIKSFADEEIETSISWRPVDSPTAKELAERNKMKAETASTLVMCGAIDGEDVRSVISKDPDSGFHDLGEKKNSLADDLGFNDEEAQALNGLGINYEESE